MLSRSRTPTIHSNCRRHVLHSYSNMGMGYFLNHIERTIWRLPITNPSYETPGDRTANRRISKSGFAPLILTISYIGYIPSTFNIRYSLIDIRFFISSAYCRLFFDQSCRSGQRLGDTQNLKEVCSQGVPPFNEMLRPANTCLDSIYNVFGIHSQAYKGEPGLFLILPFNPFTSSAHIIHHDRPILKPHRSFHPE